MRDKPNILVVDDTPESLVSLVDTLTPEGYAVRAVSSGELALAAAGAGPPDLILVDVNMPGMDGLEVCRRLKALRGLQLGAADYISAPVQPEELLMRVKTHLALGRAAALSHQEQAAELSRFNEELQAEIAERRRIEEDLRESLMQSEVDRKALLLALEDRMRAEDALTESMARFAAIADNTPDHVIIHDRALRYTFVVNPQLGFIEEDMIGKTDYDFLSKEEADRLTEVKTQVLESGKPLHFETSLVSLTGEAEHFDGTYIPRIDAQGQADGLIGYFRNVTERKHVEEALRLSEGRYRELFSSMSSGVAVYVAEEDGEDFIIIDINQGVERIEQIGREYLIGKRVTEAFPGVREFGLLDVLQRVWHTGTPERHPVGLYHDQRITGWRENYVYRLPSGEIVAVYDDMTERKQAEEALRRSEAELRAILDATPFPIALVDVQDSNIDFWSRSALTLFGQTAPTTAAWYEMAYPDPNYRREVIERWRPRLEEARLSGKAVNTGVYQVTCRDGAVRMCELYAAFLSDRLIVTFNDVTERIMAAVDREELLVQVREQAQRVQGILDTVPEGVALIDTGGYVLQANPVATRQLANLTGLSAGEPIDHLGDRQLADLLSSPPTRGLWHEVRHGSRTFEVITRSVARGPEPERYVLVLNDVTREREIRAELQQQERLAAVGQLAAGIAHDFNNILAVIVLYAQMDLLASDLSDRRRAHLQTIVQEANHASSLIQQILDFGRRAVLEPSPLDLVPFLKERVKLLRRTLPESIGIELNCSLDEAFIKADPTRMQQMITNLALNARDAMPDGGKLVVGLESLRLGPGRLGPLQGMTAGSWILVTVSDTGVGIGPEVWPHLFEPFFTTKGPGKGTGLGLAQVYGIVKQHDGYIGVHSQVGQGSTFTISLPALEPTRSVNQPVTRSTLPKARGELILIVEDSDTLRQAIVSTLASLGYRTLDAANGREALAILEQQTAEIDLVLSDMVMPEMGGQALFYALQARDLTLPMVIMTGHPMEHERVILEEQGLAGWVLKPPAVEDLAATLARALHSKDTPM